MKLLVLAGGFGTRLKTVVADRPKALVPVGSKPLLSLQIRNWRDQGIHSFVFLLHHKATEIIDFVDSERNASLLDSEVECVVERNPLGTGGSVANAIRTLNLHQDFLLVNADTWLSTGMQALTQAKSPSIGVIHVPDASRYGCVKLNTRSQVTDFQEKSLVSEPGLINAGIAKLSPRHFNEWDGHAFSIEHNLYPRLVAEKVLTGVTLQGTFTDIGVPEDYMQFCSWAAINSVFQVQHHEN
jgi:D-glycero-alpha-D-manno-heptose 1-phosphate guanylyltransferase